MIMINEIFYSLQGEGQWMGLPNIFIRTTGCNLRCSYCDTTYAYTDGKPWNLSDIIDHISKFKCKKVCITGGEPLTQTKIFDLIASLLTHSFEIIVETNGSLPVDKLIEHDNLIVSMDVKCPSSNMHEHFHKENMNILRSTDQIKFIIGNKEDYEYAQHHIMTYKPTSKIYFQPVWNTDHLELAEWILQDNLPVFFGVQLHKLLWGNKRHV